GAILLIQLRLGFSFNLALCTVLQTIPMALPTARGRNGRRSFPHIDERPGRKAPGHLFLLRQILRRDPPRKQSVASDTGLTPPTQEAATSRGSALPPNSRSPVETHGFRRTRQGSPCPLQPEEIEISHHVPSTGAAIPLAPSVEQDERADGLFAAAEGQSGNRGKGFGKNVAALGGSGQNPPSDGIPPHPPPPSPAIRTASISPFGRSAHSSTFPWPRKTARTAMAPVPAHFRLSTCKRACLSISGSTPAVS